jgi:DNA-binding winged helix-turn-helix (wHTH) protein
MLAAMIYRFGSFALDPSKAELRSDDNVLPMEPQVFALLSFLVEHHDRLVSKEELLEKVWDGRIVSDAAIASRIKSARKVLGDDGKTQRFIRTLHRQGFRFVAAVRFEREAAVLGYKPPNVHATAEPTAIPAFDASRPSLAVLPFHLIGDAGNHGSIADALAHDLIAELARLRWLFITARGSSFRLRDPNLDMRDVGRLLGVRYCLTGSVIASPRRLDITTELAETESGQVVWAERVAGAIEDVHVLRDELRVKLLTALDIRIPLREAARARLMVSESLDAWSAYHLGIQYAYRFNRKDNLVAAGLFERAVTLDPTFARAYAGLSFVHFQAAFLRHSNDVTEETRLARDCAEHGLDLDPLDPFVNFTMGRSFWLVGDLEGSFAWLERATELCPNYAQGIYACAWTESLSGRELQAREHADLAMRLSPLDPLYYAMLGTRGVSHLALGEYAEAATWVERAARSPGAHVLIAMIAAAAQSLAGDASRAAAWADNVRERNPQLTRGDFFRAFPMQASPSREQTAAALAGLGF